MTDAEIKEKAFEVDKISYDYHLTHAVFACDKMLSDSFRKAGREKTKKMNSELQEAYRKKDTAKITKIMDGIKSHKVRKYHIFVDYINIDDPDAGRVIKAENKLIISLPITLAVEARDESGLFQPGGVKKLRRVMAHELGHIVLHTESLIETDNLNGSRDLQGRPEQEAEIFAKELLRLREKRNELFRKAVG
ncbi:MAG: ImmA/IrrE family metallo-endopeptidase [Treponema sp.]|jgi:hypothetical protein|nr:ImmA/IrrE family metallo-endopeptidase [Treponema sp.]